jgi:hypothetical protein
MTPKPLTARGVKLILSRNGVNHSALTITDDPQMWTDLDTGAKTASVKIEGPKELRRAATRALFDKGLSEAPYPEYDLWSRR